MLGYDELRHILSSKIGRNIQWNKSDQVFEENFEHALVNIEIPNYVDSKLDGKIKPEEIQPLLQKIEKFSFEKYSYQFKSLDVDQESDIPGVIRSWIGEKGRLDFIILNTNDGKCHDYAILFESGSHFLILGTCYGYPFVRISQLVFDAQKNSSEEKEDLLSLDFSQVKTFAQTRLQKYLFP